MSFSPQPLLPRCNGPHQQVTMVAGTEVMHELGHMDFHSLRPVQLSVQFISVAQSCLTLCDPIDGSPPGSPVPGILQARTLEWGAIVFSKTSYYSCLIPTSTEECWGHLPVPMVPRKGSVFSTVTPTPHPRLLTARPESCYGDSQESSEDPLTAPTMVSPPFP